MDKTCISEREIFNLTKTQQLSGAYLFHGVEELTKNEAIDRIKATLNPACVELNVESFRFPLASELIASCNTLPFFDEKRLVLVRDWKNPDIEPILDKLASLPSSCILIFVQRGTEKSTTLLYKKLFELNRIVEFAQLTEDRAIDLLNRESALYGCSLDRTVARQLIMRVGTDAYRLKNELSKLADYVGRGKAITEQALKIVVTPSPEFDVFTLLNYLLAGNKRGGLRLLKNMIADGQPALSLAFFLEGRIRLMLHAKELSRDKVPLKDAVKQLGGSPKAAEIAYKNAQKQDEAKLRRALIMLAEVNLRLVQGLATDEESLFTAICQCF